MRSRGEPSSGTPMNATPSHRPGPSIPGHVALDLCSSSRRWSARSSWRSPGFPERHRAHRVTRSVGFGRSDADAPTRARADARTQPTPEPVATPTPDPDPTRFRIRRRRPNPLHAGARACLRPDAGAGPDARPGGDPAPTPIARGAPVRRTGRVRVIAGFRRSAGGPAPGRSGHPAHPQLTVTPADPLRAAVLSRALPAGWAVVDAGQAAPMSPGDAVDLGPRSTSPAASRASRSISCRLRRRRRIDGGLVFEASFAARLVHSGGSQVADPLDVLVAPRIAIEHAGLRRIADRDHVPTYPAVDAAIRDEQRFDTFRVRFQLRNRTTSRCGSRRSSSTAPPARHRSRSSRRSTPSTSAPSPSPRSGSPWPGPGAARSPARRPSRSRSTP